MPLLQPFPKRWKPEPWPWSWSRLEEPYASIAKKCAFLLPMWEKGGNQRCLVTRTVLTRSTGTSNIASPYGIGIGRKAGTLDHLVGPSGFRPVIDGWSTGYTIFGIANPSASAVAAGSGTLYLQRKTAPWVQFGILFNMEAGGTEGNSGYVTAYNYNDTSSWSYKSTQSTTGVDGRWHTWASRTTAGGSAITLWRDGVSIGSLASFGSFSTLADSTQIVTIGGLNTSGFGMVGGIGLVAVWGTPLANWEVLALHDDPMGLIRARAEQRIFFPAPANNRTATGAVTTPMQQAAGDATRTIPVFSASGAQNLPMQTMAGAATFAEARAAAGAISSPMQQATGAASFDAGTFTGAGAATTPMQQAAGTATYLLLFEAAGGFTAPMQQAAGAATREIPVFSADGAFSTTILTIEGTATSVPPNLLDGSVTTPMQQAAGASTFVPGSNGVGDIAIPMQATAGDATRTIPVFTLDGDAVLPVAAVAGEVATTEVVRTGSGAVAIPMQQATGLGQFDAGPFMADGAVAIPMQMPAGTIVFDAGTYTATGSALAPMAQASGTATFMETEENDRLAFGEFHVPPQSAIGFGLFEYEPIIMPGAYQALMGKAKGGVTAESFAVGPVQSANYTASPAVIANPFLSETVRVVCSTAAYIAIGPAPTATTSDIYLPAGKPEYLMVRPGEKISAVRVASDGVLRVMECA